MAKVRLDQLIYDRHLTESKERAKTTVMAGIVYVNGQKADKPGMQVTDDVDIEIRGNSLPYVSRGGLKLEKALKVFNVDVKGKVCIDCGASTGGFTDVMLQNGAVRVYSVDVGYGQLAWKLRNDDRVVNMERTNIRYLTPEDIPEKLDFASIDVSFISLKLILPPVCSLLKDNADVICLIKPQFEAGREKVGKKGVVHDIRIHEEVVRSILEFAPSVGLYPVELDYSPIKGPEGNIEYICHLSNRMQPNEIDVCSVVSASHENLKVIL